MEGRQNTWVSKKDEWIKEKYYGLNYVPPSSYVEVLTPSTSRCDSIWRLGL
mgnify:CR=1 FL=1